jgi:hypothetical protein
MKATILMIGAVALGLAPTLASAAPSTNRTTAPTAAGGPTATGQPGQDCEDLVDSGEGSFPGNSYLAPGSAFNEDPGGVAGSKYAGEQPQNTVNLATSSQYDVACLHGTQSSR